MDELIASTKQKMLKVIDVLKTDLSTVRTGRAAPSLVENIFIEAYGGTQKFRVVELAHVSSSDPQTLLVTPFDPSIIGEIRKGIQEANVGLNPVIDGQVVRISIPPLSQERREQLIQLVHQKLEGGKIQIRQMRHDAINDVKKLKDSENLSEDNTLHLEKEIQKLTDEFTLEIENLGKKKEEELLAI